MYAVNPFAENVELRLLYILGACVSLEGLIRGGVTISSHFVDGIATYTCSAGYELVGTSSRICQPDGEWSTIESKPYCDSKCCFCNNG